jgi:beta-phosphoglucomutase-like phosphatase (HAD superfamily)
MNLAIFDIDGTLTESVAIDESCFVQAFRDVLGIGPRTGGEGAGDRLPRPGHGQQGRAAG